MNVSYLVCGSITVRVRGDNVTALLNLCMYYCIPYTDFKSVYEGVEMTFRLPSFRKMKHEAENRGIEFEVVRKGGIPALFHKYRYRFGMFLGVILAAALVFLSESFVWDINVTGNESLTATEIRKLLASEGLFEGSYIRNVNTDKIENTILMNTENISWMSINIIGTVAEVQIREYRAAVEVEDISKPANLVAKKAGLVEEVRILRGNVVVSQGRYVEKGDLLVSGLYDSLQEGVRYTRASGQVYAKTFEEIYIEIPYKFEEKRYTGAEYYDKYLNFFDFSINISKNSRNEGVFYDKISIVENYRLWDGNETPFGFTAVKYLEYETVEATRSREEAEELAYFELSHKLGEMAENAILIQKTVKPIDLKDSFALLCSVIVIEDIAEQREFEVEIE